LQYMPKVIELYGEYIVNMTVIQQQEFGAVPVLEFNSPF